MTEGQIFIQGIISPWQDGAAEEFGEVNIKQVTKQIQDNADADKLIVHIHSPGGDVDEGFGIHDLLVSSGKEIETRIEGLCASIATVIFLAGSTRKITENSDAMIHTPWGMNEGDAEDMQKYADELKKIEKKILDFYVKKTDGDREAIKQMMKDETWLTAKQLKDLGFATEIITTIKAVAKYNFKNINMETQTFLEFKELNNKIDNKFTELLKKIGLAKGAKAQALMVTTADETVLDFGDQIESEEEIEVGMTATIEGGGTPEGDYVMTDGSTLVFAEGKITEMKPAEEEETEEMKALKAENEALKKELADLKASNEKAITDLEQEVVDIKAQVKSDISTFEKGNVPGSPDPEPSRSPGKPITGI